MSLRRLHFGLIALALLAAQTLALLHGLVHLAGHAPSHGIGATSGRAQALPHARGAEALASLFGAHAEDADCRLLDQLNDAPMPLPHWSVPDRPVAAVWSASWRDAALRVLQPAPPGRGPPILA